MQRIVSNPLLYGIILLCLSTLSTTLADGTIKSLSSRLDAPQVFFISGILMAMLSAATACIMAMGKSDGAKGDKLSFLRTNQPVLVGIRSIAAVCAALGFFYALAQITLAEVFIFIGLMPLASAILSRIILKEGTPLTAWIGLVIGMIGMIMLFPQGISQLCSGHVYGFIGAFSGTLSLIISRLIARKEQNTLVQVFYPNVLVALTSLALLPGVWVEMRLSDVVLIVTYSYLLFVARWSMVMVMQRLRAQVVLPLMNIQFVWMVIIGYLFFDEIPEVMTVLGAIMIMIAGSVAVLDQARNEKRNFITPNKGANPVYQ